MPSFLTNWLVYSDHVTESIVQEADGVLNRATGVLLYILQSLKTKKLYIGHTDKLDRRLNEHNTSRGGKYTRQNSPWILVYSEPHPNRASAARRERHLKSTRGSQEKKKLAGVLK